MLSFIYDVLDYDEIQTPEGSSDQGTFTQFCQREFFPQDTDWETNEHFKDRQNGWIYTPADCQGELSAGCKVHFAFHGCGARA